jgi:hypothetical protein
MINTTGIQSTGPQGLPGSPSQAAVVDEQDVAQFNQMMLGTPNNPSAVAQPQSAATKTEIKAYQEELQSKYQAAMANYEAAKQTGDPKQIQNAVTEIFQIANQGNYYSFADLKERLKDATKTFEQIKPSEQNKYQKLTDLLQELNRQDPCRNLIPKP